MSLYSIYFCFGMNKSKSTQMDRIHRNSTGIPGICQSSRNPLEFQDSTDSSRNQWRNEKYCTTGKHGPAPPPTNGHNDPPPHPMSGGNSPAPAPPHQWQRQPSTTCHKQWTRPSTTMPTIVECRVDIAVTMLYDFEQPLYLCLVLQLQLVNYPR